ncbi:MAG: hypothetical protein CVV63_00195 [Tenericutes bacterium HGW-Tenericutes-8]|nr:MAG: hypothetical protein CVV63_00195 [Tenericutes bacterium HGW-Tenericutes-8]
MKKWMILLLILVMCSIKKVSIRADTDYQAFESIEIYEGKFLKDYTKAEYKSYYKKVTKRKFTGWRINIVHEDLKVVYKTETIFSYYNDGTTPIKYEYKFEGSNTSSRSITSTGEIGINVSGPIKVFKGGLDAKLKITSSYETTKKETETFKMTMDIDPQTMANLYIHGEGLITNGVACRYWFWIPFDKGGFEVFVITTQYYRMEKVKI